MTEACMAIMDFAFSALRIKAMRSRHHVDNPASGAVMKKCGMRHIKTEYMRVPDCERISGDYLFYEMSAGEWNRNQ
jgi:ribosomal-protein-alanine N-acetyltransferase